MRLNRETMDAIEVWSADILFPPELEFSGGWVEDDEVSTTNDDV